jgi:hypothetical protein
MQVRLLPEVLHSAIRVRVRDRRDNMLKKWYFWVALVVVLGCGGSVLYGVLTHKEPGFMGVCWDANGSVASYHDPLKDPHPECTTELKWKKEQFPLTYYVAFDADHKTYIDSVVKGAEMWNREIGRELFKRSDKEEGAVIQVTWGSVEPGSHSGGHTTHTGGPGGPTGAKLVLSNPSDVHAVYRYAAHEWGHVLGLAHDDFSKSIMYSKQPDVTEEMTFVLPSDFDKKILKEAYR